LVFTTMGALRRNPAISTYPYIESAFTIDCRKGKVAELPIILLPVRFFFGARRAVVNS
jgi:hypothetical protein